MEIEIPDWFKLEYVITFLGGGVIYTFYKFSLKIDGIYDDWFRKSSSERFSRYFKDGLEKVRLIDAVSMSESIVDHVFYHDASSRPKFRRTCLFSLFAMLLGVIFSFTYYDRYLVPGDDYIDYTWFMAVISVLVGLNLLFDFLSIWFTRVCLSRMTTTLAVLFFTALDFVVSAILSPFFWLSTLAFFYISLPMFDMPTWLIMFAQDSDTVDLSAFSTIVDLDSDEELPGLGSLLEGVEPRDLPVDLPVYEPPRLSLSDRWFWFTFSLRIGVLGEFMSSPSAIFHTTHVHFYHVIGVSLLIGSLISSILTSLGVWIVYLSFVTFRLVRLALSPVVFASNYLDLAAEKRPIGSLMIVNGIILFIVFGIFTLLTA